MRSPTGKRFDWEYVYDKISNTKKKIIYYSISKTKGKTKSK